MRYSPQFGGYQTPDSGKQQKNDEGSVSRPVVTEVITQNIFASGVKLVGLESFGLGVIRHLWEEICFCNPKLLPLQKRGGLGHPRQRRFQSCFLTELNRIYVEASGEPRSNAMAEIISRVSSEQHINFKVQVEFVTGARPGIGKSAFLAQIALRLHGLDKEVVYCFAQQGMTDLESLFYCARELLSLTEGAAAFYHDGFFSLASFSFSDLFVDSVS